MGELYRPRVGILASGGGTTAHAYAKSIHKGTIKHDIALVISSDPEAGILDKANDWSRYWEFDTKAAVINKHTHPKGKQQRGQTEAESAAICELGAKHGIDLFVALGYMVIINDPFIETYGYVPSRHTSKYQARALNTHPGPLPLTADTYGDGASEKALTAYRRGEIEMSEQTVHVIAQEIDAGPVVVAHDVPILDVDTAASLFTRAQGIEKATIGYAIDMFWRDQQEYRSNEV